MSDESSVQVSKRSTAIGRSPLLLLLLLALVRGCLYAVVVPPWQAPDENGHFEYAWLIAHLERLPDRSDLSPGFERELLSSLYEWHYGEFIERPLPESMPTRMQGLPLNIFARRSRTILGLRFSPAYIWQALFIWPFRHQDLVPQLYAARFSSVLLNVAIVGLAWRIFRSLVPEKWAAAMTALVVFLPQHTFINAAVGEGSLAELATCVAFYGWLRLLLNHRPVQGVAAIVVGTGLGMYAKFTAATLLPLDIVMTAVFLWHLGSQRARRQALVYGTLVLIALALVTWSAWRTPVGHRLCIMVQQWASNPVIYWENGRVTLSEALRYTFESFWAQFGWMSARAGDGWYVMIYLLMVFAIEGWFWPRSRPWTAPAPGIWLMGVALLLNMTGWLAFVVGTPTGLAYYQGRYLFPATIPVAFFVVGGWARWAPERWQRFLVPGTVTLLAALDAAVFCLTLWPFFYGQ